MKRGFTLSKVITVLVVLNLVPISVVGLLSLRQWWTDVLWGRRYSGEGGEAQLVAYGTRRGKVAYVVISENPKNAKDGLRQRVQDFSTGEIRLHLDDGTWIKLPSKTQVYRFSGGVMTKDPRRYTQDELQAMVD